MVAGAISLAETPWSISALRPLRRLIQNSARRPVASLSARSGSPSISSRAPPGPGGRGRRTRTGCMRPSGRSQLRMRSPHVTRRLPSSAAPATRSLPRSRISCRVKRMACPNAAVEQSARNVRQRERIATMLFYGTMRELSDLLAGRATDNHLDEDPLLLATIEFTRLQAEPFLSILDSYAVELGIRLRQ